MSVINDVRDAIATAVADALGISPYEYRPSSPPLTNSVSVGIAPFDYDLTFDDDADLRILVRLIVPSAQEQSAQALLDEWLSPTGTRSSKAAIEADPSLGDLVSSTRVVSVSNVGPLQFTDGRMCQAGEQVVSVYL